MVITDLGNDTYNIYLAPTDMDMLRRSSADTGRELSELVMCRICQAMNICGFKFMKAEFFEGQRDALVFVSINRGSPVYFSFDGFEKLVEALSDCAPEAASSLTLLDENYILTLYPEKSVCGLRVPFRLSEFGERLPYSPEYDLFIKEHGKVIISSGAIGQLKKVFCGG